MNKMWRRAAVAAVVIAIAYALTGYAFYQRQSQLTISNKIQPTGKYSFPIPGSHLKKGYDNPAGNPFIDLNTTSISSPQTSPAPVVSNLILLGTLSGPNPQAVVAEKSNPGITHILRRGESWMGERIVSIGKGSIVIWKDNQKVMVQTAP